MAYQCRQQEILEERRKKSISGDNKFVPLLSKVYRRMEGEFAVCPEGGKAQPTRCWECGEVEHVLWGCPNRAVQLQSVRATGHTNRDSRNILSLLQLSYKL